MERVNRIIRDDTYRDCYGKIKQAEQERRFCHHDMVHFLDVARLAAVLNLEEQCRVSRELIYAAAMLHDIGRFEQYRNGTPHEIASARIAPEILKRCGYTQEETDLITDAIISHRNAQVKEEPTLRGLIYRADKLSRSCFACEAERECDWKKEKKNLKITY